MTGDNSESTPAVKSLGDWAVFSPKAQPFPIPIQGYHRHWTEFVAWLSKNEKRVKYLHHVTCDLDTGQSVWLGVGVRPSITQIGVAFFGRVVQSGEMARKLRLQYEGAIYHIAVRGNGRRKIFADDRDRDRLLWRLCESKEIYEVRVYVYCLMDNHFHLLVETPRANISRFMQSVLTGYTVYFNLRHQTSGHVLQGRFGGQLVQGDHYLLNVSRYIHLNPVQVRTLKGYSAKQKAQYLKAYRWSSYRGYIEARKRNELVDYGPVLSLMDVPKRGREAKYRDFVRGGLVSTDEEFMELMKTKPRSIGSNQFRKWVDEEYEKLKSGMGSPEDVSFRREAELMEADEVLDVVALVFGLKKSDLRRRVRDSIVRPVAARMLCKHADMTQRAAGRLLGYGKGSAVSMQMKRLEQKLAEGNSDAQQYTAKIEKRITALLRFKCN